MNSSEIKTLRSPYLKPFALVGLLLGFAICVGLILFADSSFEGLVKWILITVSLYGIFCLVLYPFARIAKVPGTSMEPTIKEKDFVVIESLSNYLDLPLKRGNIIGFYAPALEGAEGEMFLFSRIVALPGEVLEVREGRLYVDDELIDEPWNLRHHEENALLNLPEPHKIAENHYAVLADCRGRGESAYITNMIGFVPRKHIHERVLFIFRI